MTFAPTSLQVLRTYLHDQAGIAYASLGIVGDNAHAQTGVSYHLGRSDLRATAYSRQTARDRAGLTEAASAIDVGKFGPGHGGFYGLRKFSVWFVGQCRANAAGTRDIREVIYSPDGRKVLRWDRERGVASAPRPGEADDTHLWHTHISFYRDSQLRDKRPLFRPYFEPKPIPPEEPMKSSDLSVFDVPTSWNAPKGAIVYDDSDEAAADGPAGTDDYVIDPARLFRALGKIGETIVIGYDRDTSKPGMSLGFVNKKYADKLVEVP